MDRIKCVGADGVEREFLCRRLDEPFFSKIRFFVKPVDQPVQDEFELVLEEESEDLLRVKMMNHHREESLSGKGIPEAILLYASVVLGRRIESSPKCSVNGQRRSEAASKAWERLCTLGKAKYNGASDTYCTM